MQSLVLVPEPRELEILSGTCRIDTDLEKKLSVYTLDSKIPVGIECSIDENLTKQEYYTLLIEPGGIDITAKTPRGLFYAVQTLRQIVRQAVKGSVPCMRIRDWPDYAVRSVMLDISRDRLPGMETIHMLIDLWSELKYNQLQFYTEHTFAYSDHEFVWKEASPLTAADIRHIAGYAAARGMELVPNQNSFGHMERWLKHPEYVHLPEAPYGFIDPWGIPSSSTTTLSPAVPESLVFLEKLYDEILPNFDSILFNVGGDETFELGKGKSKTICAEQGLSRVYIDFIKKNT